jgi:Fe-S cluster assembly protein SufD
MEDWRCTDLRQLIDRPYPPRLAVAETETDIARLVAASPFAGVAGQRLVFVNGRHRPDLSQRANGGATAHGPADGELILAMNGAFADDGARLSLAGNADLPVELVFITSRGAARAIAIRNVIEVEAGASATIIETHLGEGTYLTNSVTEMRLGAGARLDRIKFEGEGVDAVHLAHALATLGPGARLADFTLHAGARLSRQNGTYVFEGEEAEARISGAYLLSGRQHVDTRLVVDHKVPRCLSRELFKCVLDGESRGIFQGKVIVRPDAQKTDGKQSSHALLLSPNAEFDAKPELEIFADDVVCGHGATAGDLDADHLFYLESRGIPAAEARALLVAAFVGEAFEAVAHEDARLALADFAERRLGLLGKSPGP